MKIVCVGGGPAGLYFGLLMKLQDPNHDVIVVERNRPYDTFGWGVVFSDATVDNLHEADPVSGASIASEFSRWEDIDVAFKGRTIRTTGHGFIGIGRKRLLNILQARCEEVGVRLVFETNVEDDQALARKYRADLVIASDGINSGVRSRYAKTFKPDVDTRKCRFVWLGTRKVFDAFNFLFVPTEHGWFAAHAYRFEDGLSTFIVETPDECWQRHGLEQMSQEDSIAFCERLFQPWLDGNPLMSNASHLRGSANWIRFPRVICDTWVHWNTLTMDDGSCRDIPVVLMGDAAHTAHFSIGSGTKLALEDAIELTRCLKHAKCDLREGLARYQEVRSVEVLKIQNAARNSTEWFENVRRYADLDPEQFTYSLLTRSQRISHENLRLRDPDWLASYERWLAAQAGLDIPQDSPAPLPLLTPYKVRGLTLKNRVVVSPMLLQAADDTGVAGDFHRVHLGSRAMSGAGLVFSEMIAVLPEGRMTRADLGLWNDQQQAALAGIADFVHHHADARFAVQLGHAGRKGAVNVGWEPSDQPLNDGWPLLAPSALPYKPGVSATPRAMDRQDMDKVRDAFVAAARRAAQAGVDWLEIQAGHGFLLSTFLSPLTNHRDDAYGAGSLEARLRFPLEVITAVREVWPSQQPMSVRLSATDWVAGGTKVDEAIEMARRLHEAGVDVVDVSTGEVSPDQRPVYGRLFQTPMADRIRNEGGVPTIAVGAITEADQINGVIASGRADLCAIGRPLMADPTWLRRELARLGRGSIEWHPAYSIAAQQFERVLMRPPVNA